MRHSYEQTPTCEANSYAPYRPLHRNHPGAYAHRRSTRRLLKPAAAARINARCACSSANHCALAYYRAPTYRRSRNAHYRARANNSARTYGRSHCAYYRTCARANNSAHNAA